MAKGGEGCHICDNLDSKKEAADALKISHDTLNSFRSLSF